MSNSRQPTLAPQKLSALSEQRRNRRRALRRTAAVVMILTPIIGCSGKQNSQWSSDKQNDKPRSTYNSNNGFQPSMYTQGNSYETFTPADQSKTYGQTSSTQNYFTQKAEKNGVPQWFVSEARIGLTEVDVRLGSARAAELDRDATSRRRNAQLWNKRTQAAVREEMSMAQIHELRVQQEAKQVELAAQLAARQRKIEVDDNMNDRLVGAWAKDHRTAQQDLFSQAEMEFGQAKAHINEVRVVRSATEKESNSAINQARTNAQATRDRASATVVALRQEAHTVTEKTSARVNDLTTQLKVIPVRFHAEANRAEAQASATEIGSIAKAEEINARANATEAQSAEHKYNLMLTLAKTNRQQSEAEAERKTTEAKTSFERGSAEVDRMRGDAHMILEDAQTESMRQFGELSAWFQRSKVDLAHIRAAADRLEKVAHAQFVKLLAQSAADAIRETNEHQQVLSEAQMNLTIAESEVKAAEVHEQIMNELEHLTRNGMLEVPGKTTPTNESLDVEVPVSEKVLAIAPKIDPQAFANLKSSMAKAVHDRMSADAQFSSLEASFNEQKTNIEVTRDQKIALGTEQLAWADTIILQAIATLSEDNANITAELSEARSTHDRALVEAETFRRDALAEVEDLRAFAKATLDTGSARAQSFRKEAETILASGKEEVEAIRTELDSTKEQGASESNRLLAKADSVEKGEAALAEQIDAQIASAQQELDAELANFDRQRESNTLIAQTNYDESLGEAEDVGMQVEMKIQRMAASNKKDKAIAQSKLERLHDIQYVEAVKNEAVLDRHFAEAVAQRAQSDAGFDAEQVAIGTDADIMTATVEAHRRIAAARINSVKSLFNTRVAEVNADRITEKAQALLASSFQRANAETILAKAEAARSNTRERMSLMVVSQKKLQRAAVQDWDSRLSKNPPEGFQP